MSLPYILAYSGVPLEWRVQREDLPKAAYVIVASTGEYSERVEWPLVVFLDKEKAQAEMAKLEAIHSTYYGALEHLARIRGQREFYKLRSVIRDKAKGDYAALGYPGLEGEEYWELSESKVKF